MGRTSFGERRGNGAQAVLVLFSVIGVIAVLSCLTCGGCTFGLFTLGAISSDDTGGYQQRFADRIAQQVQDLPDVKQHVGQIKSIRTSRLDSEDVQEEFHSKDFWSFDVRGTKGRGKILVECADLDVDPHCTRRILRMRSIDYDLGPTPQVEQPADAQDPEDIFDALKTANDPKAEVDVPVPAAEVDVSSPENDAPKP